MQSQHFEKLQPLLQKDVDSSGCTLYENAESLIQTKSNKYYCIYCFEFCVSPNMNEEIFSHLSINGSSTVCSCKHRGYSFKQENPDFCRNNIQKLKEIKDWSIKKQLAFNLFLVHEYEGVSVFEVGFPESVSLIKSDKENHINGKFQWAREEIGDIETRINFLNIFDIDLNSSRLNLLNLKQFKNLFPITLFNHYTNVKKYPDNRLAHSKVLEFEDKLIKCFIKLYIEPDLNLLDRIEAKNLESLHPIARENTRSKNLQNTYFKENYMTNEFNLFEFAMNLFDRFVPIQSYEIKHSTLNYGIQLLKILIEFGFLEKEKIEILSEKAYSKLLNFKQFEDDILQKDLSEEWVADAITIRKFYTEIMIHILYFRQDKEILKIMNSIWEVNPGLDNFNMISEEIRFSDDTIFEPDLGRKILEIVFGYIMSTKTHRNQAFESQDILNVMDNFLMLFSNINDPYLFSINLMGAEDLAIYKNTQMATRFKEKIIGYAKDVDLLRAETINATKSDLTNIAITRITQIMDDLCSNLNFDFQIQTMENFSVQREINDNNIFVSIMKFIFGLTVEAITPEFIGKFTKFCKVFLFMNSETQSIFLQDYYFDTNKELMKIYPMETLSIFYDVFNVYPRVLLANPESLFFFLDLHKNNCPTSLIDNSNTDIFQKSMLIIDILKIYLSPTRKRDNVYLSEYDILIGDHLGDKADTWTINHFGTLIGQENGNLSKIQFDHAIKYYDCLRKAIEFRFSRKTYDVLANMTFETLRDTVDKLENLYHKEIFMELFTELHIDFKNNLLNQRNGFYVRKPIDMQYDEDIFVQKDYTAFFEFLLKECEYVMREYPQGNEETKKELKHYLVNSIFYAIFKSFNLFSYIKPNDTISQLKSFMTIFEKVDDYFYSNLGKYEDVLGDHVSIDFQKKTDSLEKNLKISEEFIKNRNMLGFYIEYIKEIVGKLMSLQKPILYRSRKNMIDPRTTVERLESSEIAISMFSNLMDVRREGQERFKENLKNKMISEKQIDLPRILSIHYRIFKHKKLSEEYDKNIYLATMKDTENKDSQTYAYNLSHFLNTQLKKTYIYGYKTFFYMLVESFTHILFVATKAIQNQFFEIVYKKETSSYDVDAFNKIFLQMKFIMNYVKHKNSIDRFYKETYVRTMLCLKFHQYICDENFTKFKNMFCTVNLPDDSVDRCQRWTTIYQRTTDLCNFHCNYNDKNLHDLTLVNRPHLILMCAFTFDMLSENVGGPYEPGQLKVYRFIYDRYNGTLKRYLRDSDSKFYILKNSLCDFMTAMSDGLNEEVVTFLTINYEMKTLNNLMKNSIKQLYFETQRREKNSNPGPITEIDCLDEITLTFADSEKLINAFKLNKYFSTHVLLEIAIKIYKFIQYIARVRAKYEMFITDRNASLISVAHMKEKGIKEEEMVVWKFLTSIIFPIEYITKDKKLDIIFYTILPKSFFLSKETKSFFFESEADRNSNETKLISLQLRIPIFESEMTYNAFAFNKMYYIYQFVGEKTFYFLEVLCILFSTVINILLLVDFQNRANNYDYDGIYLNVIQGLAIAEVIVSFVCLLFWFLVKYKLTVEKEKQKYFDFRNVPDKMSFVQFLYIGIFKSLYQQEVSFVFIYHILFTILGLAVSVGFYGIDFLAIVTLTATFKTIVKSITDNIFQFIFTYFFGVIVMFSYALFTHIYYFTAVQNIDANKVVHQPAGFTESKCFSLVRCLWALMNEAFRNGQGVSDLMQPESFNDQNYTYYFARMFLEISFFLVVNILLLNLIFGILIDTFGRFRVQRELFGS